jgi:hypothetical protein
MTEAHPQLATTSLDTRHVLRHRIFWPAAVFCLFFLLGTLAIGPMLIRDQDTFWHIASGRDIWTTGSLPWVDKYSHTFAGQRWIAKEWLSQVLLAGTYELFGFKGLIALASTAIALSLTILFVALSYQLQTLPALVGTVFAFLLSSPHFVARPHLLSYPLMVFWMMSVVRAADRGTVPSLLLLPIIVVWANVHAGFSLGLAIAGALALEAVIASAPSERWTMARGWGLFLAGALLASFVTPYGVYALYNTYQIFGGNEALQLINEWRPFNFGEEPILGGLLFLALFTSLYFGVKFPFVRCATVVLLLYMTMIHIRFVSVLAPVALILMAGPLARQFDYLRANAGSQFTELVDLTTRPTSLALISVFTGAALALASLTNPHPPIWSVPVGAVDYIQAHRKDEKVFNAYQFGGYLIFRGIPSFIDGRTDQLFLGGFMSGISQALKGPRSEFLKLLDKYDVTLALVLPKSPAAYRLSEADTWREVYSDEAASVYTRLPR